MKKNLVFSIALLVLIVFGSANAAKKQPTECQFDGNQMQLNDCAGQTLNRADFEMNRLYKQQMDRLSEKNQARLQESQRAWITYRDKTCLYETGPREESGSIWPMQDSICKATLTKQRNEVLKKYVECTQNGCPE